MDVVPDYTPTLHIGKLRHAGTHQTGSPWQRRLALPHPATYTVATAHSALHGLSSGAEKSALWGQVFLKPVVTQTLQPHRVEGAGLNHPRR